MSRTARNLILSFSILATAPTAVVAQIRPAGYKDPSTALALAFLVPGGGHLYAGESGKGWTLFLLGTGSAVAGTAIAFKCQTHTEDLGGYTSTSKDCGPRPTPLLLGAAVYTVTWIIGMTDAGPAARRANARHGLALGEVTVAPMVTPSATDTRIGLSVRF